MAPEVAGSNPVVYLVVLGLYNSIGRVLDF